jgi:hypothetical protein
VKTFLLGPAAKAIRNEELSCTEKRRQLKRYFKEME